MKDNQQPTDPILAMLDEMDKAAERANVGLHDTQFSLGERLDFVRGRDQAAANRFPALALAYRKLHAAQNDNDRPDLQELNQLLQAAENAYSNNPSAQAAFDYIRLPEVLTAMRGLLRENRKLRRQQV